MLLHSPPIRASNPSRCSPRLLLSLVKSKRARVPRRAQARASKDARESMDELDLDLPPSSSSSCLLALKEWHPVVAGLASGKVIILLRKGGVREPRFLPRARSFVLIPTSHHTDAEVLKSELSPSIAFDQRDPSGIGIDVFARVTGAWTVSGDEESISAAVEALAAFHPYISSSSSPSSTLARLGFRPGTPLTLLELRAFGISPAVHVPAEVAESYWGCRSWVELGDAEAEQIRKSTSAAAAAAFSPALADEAFSAKARALREALSLIRGVESLELPSL